jgi:MFS transporter, YNFM family, putative membrane transport protein
MQSLKFTRSDEIPSIAGCATGTTCGLPIVNMPITNGLTNGLANGLTNGLANGLTNGLTVAPYVPARGVSVASGVTGALSALVDREVADNTVSRLPATREKQIPIAGILGIAVAGCCAFLNLYTTQPLLPMLVDSFHTSKWAVSLTVSAPSLAVALSAPFIGVLADRIGRKRIIIPAIFLLIIPNLMSAVAPSIGELVFCRFLQGLFLPAIFAVTMAYVAEEWAEYGLGFAISVYVTGNVIGSVTGRLVSGLVAASYGWRNAFFALAAINFVGGIAAWCLLPRSQRFKKSTTSTSMLQNVQQQVKDPRLLATFIVGSNLLFSMVATFTYITFHLSEKPYNLDATALSWLFTVYLVSVFFTPFAGRWIDKFGFQKAVLVTLSISICGMLLTLVPNLVAILIGLIISSSALIISQTATQTSMRTFAGANMSAATGLYVCFYYFGGCLGGFLPSLAWDAGAWPACVLMIISCQLLAMTCAKKCWPSPNRA